MVTGFGPQVEYDSGSDPRQPKLAGIGTNASEQKNSDDANCEVPPGHLPGRLKAAQQRLQSLQQKHIRDCHNQHANNCKPEYAPIRAYVAKQSAIEFHEAMANRRVFWAAKERVAC